MRFFRFLAYNGKSPLSPSGKARDQPPANDSESEPKRDSRKPIVYRYYFSQLLSTSFPYLESFFGASLARSLDLLRKFFCQIGSNHGFGSIPHQFPKFVLFLIAGKLALLLM